MSQVKHFMKTEIKTIDIDTTVLNAVKVMDVGGYVIILKEGKPVGIVTERDVITKVLAKDRDPSKTSVADIMSSPLITTDPDDDLTTASQVMRKHNVGKLVVMRQNIIYGVITDMIISQHFQDYMDRTIRNIIRWTPG